MSFVNVTELIVVERLNKILEDSDCCKCEICMNDMIAYALNRLRNIYVNTSKGELITRAKASELQNSIDIDVAVMQAIQVIKNKKNH